MSTSETDATNLQNEDVPAYHLFTTHMKCARQHSASCMVLDDGA